jgi:TatD DNase family protein
MFVDIHTHNRTTVTFPTIRNLTLSEAGEFFTSTEVGFVSVGVHPWFAHEFNGQTMQYLENWATDKRMIAIGECGLDKNSKTQLETQLEVFKQQIALSEKVQKPLIIHCVGCFNELFDLKKTLEPKQLWIIHGFRGKPELAKQALKSGCSLSFGEHFNPDSVKLTPIEKLYIETDESKLEIADIYTQIASIKNLTADELTAGEAIFKQFGL